ncbi:hypothetical protein ACQ4PT_015092 [Festuca glaucescens]
MATQSCEKNTDMARSPVSKLTDDLLVEIISRLPFKATRRCKCVSTRWRDLVSHPDHQKMLPQSTLAGFFYQYYSGGPSKRPRPDERVGELVRPLSLSFLLGCKKININLFDCCNGLLLCRRRWKHNTLEDYVVCNPATEKWVAVPAIERSSEVEVACLAFDPAGSSHFHVFEFAPAYLAVGNMRGEGNDTCIEAMRIYSSKLGVWTYGTVWGTPIRVSRVSNAVFFSGLLYISSNADVITVDMKVNCRIIHLPTPRSYHDDHDVYLSQGQLHLAYRGASELSIWVLEDPGTENWTLKHNVTHLQLLRAEYSMLGRHYIVISIHPEHNVVFITSRNGIPTKIMSCNMDSRKVCSICDIGWGCQIPYLSYVPSFSESLADGH